MSLAEALALHLHPNQDLKAASHLFITNFALKRNPPEKE
jgi:hypothetical protein